MRGAGVEQLRRRVAQAVGQRHRLARRIVRQAEHDQIDLAPSCRAARPGSLRRSAGRLLSSTSGSARSRSRMPRPVVPASPSMNTASALAYADGQAATSSRPHDRPTAQRLLNWKLRRALALPYFLRSTTRESRVRKPATFRMPRRSGS